MNPEEKSLHETIVDLKSELRKISMMDEFAKYAKIERKINKLTEERKKHRKYFTCPSPHVEWQFNPPTLQEVNFINA